MSKLDTKEINEKLDKIFNKLGSAAKIIIALCFVLRISNRGDIGITTPTKTKHCLKNRIFCVQSRFDYNAGKNLISWSNALQKVRTQGIGSS